MFRTSLLIHVVALCAMLTTTLLATPAFAQCTDNQGGVIAAEGESPDGQPCLICRDEVLEELPVRTVCGEDRFECRDDGVYREECAEQDDTVVCMPVNRSPNCPGGFSCAAVDDGMYCLSSCEDDGDCRGGYECRLERCVSLGDPDMGSTPDMGDGVDMGPGPDMSSSDDVGPGADQGNGGTDGGASDDTGGSTNGGVTDEGCCAVVNHETRSPAMILAMLVMLVAFRSRSRQANQ